MAQFRQLLIQLTVLQLAQFCRVTHISRPMLSINSTRTPVAIDLEWTSNPDEYQDGCMFVANMWYKIEIIYNDIM